MVASYYLIKPFYSLHWRILNFISPRRETVFYVHSAIDLQNWLPVQKFLAQIPLVSDKANTRKELRDMGYRVRPLPVFPKAVIMCRVATHKFPSRKVIKVGMTHGAYHFKRMPKAENYHPFSLYLFTSPQDLANAEKIMQGLKIPYHVVVNCTGDLGQGQVKKYDIEAWVPSENKYRETHSISYFHDFQTRRSNIKYKDAEGKTRFVHSLNGTALASPRIIVPLIENYQQKDGSILIPEVLQPYLGGRTVIR